MKPERFAPIAPDDARLLFSELSALDPVRAASLAFYPAEARGGALALSRFFTEAVLIPSRVSEPTMGAIRAQWWRDALDEVFGGDRPRAHPLVRALAATVGGTPAHRAGMDAALDAALPLLEFGRFNSAEEAIDAAAPFAPEPSLAALLGCEPTEQLERLGALTLAIPALCDAVAPARDPAIETAGQRINASIAAAPKLGGALRAMTAEAAGRVTPDTVLPTVLPFAAARRQLRVRTPGALGTRTIMLRAMLTGRV